MSLVLNNRCYWKITHIERVTGEYVLLNSFNIKSKNRLTKSALVPFLSLLLNTGVWVACQKRLTLLTGRKAGSSDSTTLCLARACWLHCLPEKVWEPQENRVAPLWGQSPLWPNSSTRKGLTLPQHCCTGDRAPSTHPNHSKTHGAGSQQASASVGWGRWEETFL